LPVSVVVKGKVDLTHRGAFLEFIEIAVARHEEDPVACDGDPLEIRLDVVLADLELLDDPPPR
jgi:hypothetical protein